MRARFGPASHDENLRHLGRAMTSKGSAATTARHRWTGLWVAVMPVAFSNGDGTFQLTDEYVGSFATSAAP